MKPIDIPRAILAKLVGEALAGLAGPLMAQHDQAIANADGATVRADINNALAALFGLSSGATEPSTRIAYQPWADTTSGLLKQRNAANTAWLVRGTLAESFVVARSSNTILAAGDFAKFFNFTSTFTQTLTAAATLADGWFVGFRNNGTGIVTLDANGSETIDGATTLAIQPGESGYLVCNGTAFITVGRNRYAMEYGQCRLTKVSTNLQLDRFNGKYLFINGQFEAIPSAGVTLAPTSAAADTTYYIYAYMSSGTMTLEYSATAPAADATYGHQIKTADATRTLVGMARTITGPAWQDSDAQRFVISYFNRRAIAGKGFFTASRSTSSTSYVELNSEIRAAFLTWADEAVAVHADGRASNDTASGSFMTSLGIDGATAEEAMAFSQAFTGGANVCFGLSACRVLSVGYHYATLLGKVGSGTGTWAINAAAQGDRTNLKVVIRG